MANSFTALGFTKPEVGADTNLWGGHLNTDLDQIDALLQRFVGTTTTRLFTFNINAVSTTTTRTITWSDVNLTMPTTTGTVALTSDILPAQTTTGTYATFTTFGSAAQIPTDDTIPQIGEGTQIISVSITPRSAANKVRLRFQGIASSAGLTKASAALFRNSVANALGATTIDLLATEAVGQLVFEMTDSPATTTSVTYSVRVGPNSGNNIRMNGNSSGRYFGGVGAASLVAEEIAP